MKKTCAMCRPAMPRQSAAEKAEHADGVLAVTASQLEKTANAWDPKKHGGNACNPLGPTSTHAAMIAWSYRLAARALRTQRAKRRKKGKNK